MFRLEATWMGQVFYDFSRGIDNRPVISEWERKSVSSSPAVVPTSLIDSTVMASVVKHWIVLFMMLKI